MKKPEAGHIGCGPQVVTVYVVKTVVVPVRALPVGLVAQVGLYVALYVSDGAVVGPLVTPEIMTGVSAQV